MPFYEVIYETGSHSIVSAESDEEALSGIKEHHKRAVEGRVGGPAGNPAERVVRILKYDRHPADFGEEQTVSKEVLEKELKELLKQSDDVVHVPEVAAALRDISNPLVESGPHDSNYKMQEAEELKWQ